jgi:pilus assembly protein TadC
MSGGTVAEALSMMSSNTHLRSLARLLADTQRHGTPAAQVAAQLTTSAHSLRRKIIDERIRRLPVRLAAPLIAGVLPAFILLAVVPLVAASMGSFNVAPHSL